MRREASRHRPSPIPTQEACSPSRHPIEGRIGRVEPRAGPSGLGPPPPTPPAAPPRLPGLRGAARRARPSSSGLVRAGLEHHPRRRTLARPAARGTRFCDTQSARTAARPSPGAARLRRSGARRPRWRDWAKGIKRTNRSSAEGVRGSCRTLGESTYPRATGLPPPSECAQPQAGGGMEWGRGGWALGTKVGFFRSFQGWDPRQGGPSSPQPPSPTLGSSLLHLNCPGTSF